jgi:hypothetical protein
MEYDFHDCTLEGVSSTVRTCLPCSLRSSGLAHPPRRATYDDDQQIRPRFTLCISRI